MCIKRSKQYPPVRFGPVNQAHMPVCSPTNNDATTRASCVCCRKARALPLLPISAARGSPTRGDARSGAAPAAVGDELVLVETRRIHQSIPRSPYAPTSTRSIGEEGGAHVFLGCHSAGINGDGGDGGYVDGAARCNTGWEAHQA